MEESAADLLIRVATGAPRKLNEIDDSIPSALAAVLTKAAAQHASERFASVAEFRDEIRRWIGGEPVLTAPPGVFVRSWMLVRQKPQAAIGALALCLLALSTAVFAYTSIRNARDARIRAEVLEQHSEQMINVGTQAQQLLRAGEFETAIIPLAMLGKHLQAGGELEPGLIQYTEAFDDLYEALEERQPTKEKE